MLEEGFFFSLIANDSLFFAKKHGIFAKQYDSGYNYLENCFKVSVFLQRPDSTCLDRRPVTKGNEKNS